MLDMELDQDLLLSSPFVGVLEWEWDDEGVWGVAELTEPAGEVALLGLGSSRLALPAIHMNFWLSKLVA